MLCALRVRGFTRADCAYPCYLNNHADATAHSNDTTHVVFYTQPLCPTRLAKHAPATFACQSNIHRALQCVVYPLVWFPGHILMHLEYPVLVCQQCHHQRRHHPMLLLA